MLMMLLYENGFRVEGVLLATSDYRMRIITRDSNDTAELRLIKDQWMTEEGDAIEIESVIMAGEAFARPVAHGHAA